MLDKLYKFSVKYDKLNDISKGETSAEIKKRVDRARKIQEERYKDYKIFSNSELTPKMLDEFCILDNESKNIMEKAFQKLGLSARAYGRILKVSRTIADLEGSENIKKEHITEAIQYRTLDRKYIK